MLRKYFMHVWVLYSLITCLIYNEVASKPQCPNGTCELEPLLGLLRMLPKMDFPMTSHDDQLQECHEQSSKNSKSQSDSLQTLVIESQKVNTDYEKASQKSISDHSRFQKQLGDKTLENQKLRQDLITKELLLIKKFDCKPNAFSVKKCRSFCTFPYSYDSCTDSNAKLEFIRRLEKLEGRCIHSSYRNSAGSACTEIHVVT